MTDIYERWSVKLFRDPKANFPKEIIFKVQEFPKWMTFWKLMSVKTFSIILTVTATVIQILNIFKIKLMILHRQLHWDHRHQLNTVVKMLVLNQPQNQSNQKSRFTGNCLLSKNIVEFGFWQSSSKKTLHSERKKLFSQSSCQIQWKDN